MNKKGLGALTLALVIPTIAIFLLAVLGGFGLALSIFTGLGAIPPIVIIGVIILIAFLLFKR